MLKKSHHFNPHGRFNILSIWIDFPAPTGPFPQNGLPAAGKPALLRLYKKQEWLNPQTFSLVSCSMIITKLFLILFCACVACITMKHAAFPKIALMQLENRYYGRYFDERNIRHPFQPHEKHAVHAFYTLIKNPSRFFPIVSPKTILSAFKNAITRHWSRKKHKPGRTALAKTTKKLILKLIKENYLWGTRRIRDELRKLSLEVSHETISKTLRYFRKTGGILPAFSWKKFLGSHWNSLFACDFFTATTFSMVT
jgi:hypothetical protein